MQAQLFLGPKVILTCRNSTAEDVAEAKESLPKEAGLVGLDGPLDQLDLTKTLAREFETEEQGSEELEKEVLVNLDLSDVIANPPRRASNQ